MKHPIPDLRSLRDHLNKLNDEQLDGPAHALAYDENINKIVEIEISEEPYLEGGAHFGTMEELKHQCLMENVPFVPENYSVVLPIGTVTLYAGR